MHEYHDITCHVIFDVNIYFTSEARFVANGSKTEDRVDLTCSSVLSRDSVQLAFLITELNDLDVMACDIGNAYLNAPCKDNIWSKAGAECGEHRGNIIILVQALYGLKTSGASWQLIFKEFIENNHNFKLT